MKRVAKDDVFMALTTVEELRAAYVDMQYSDGRDESQRRSFSWIIVASLLAPSPSNAGAFSARRCAPRTIGRNARYCVKAKAKTPRALDTLSRTHSTYFNVKPNCGDAVYALGELYVVE